MTTDDRDTRRPSRADPEGPTDPTTERRLSMPAGGVLVAMLVCLLVWGVLYAPELKRSSEAQPDGLRRTVSLAILSPVVWVSDHVGLTAATDAAEQALGRDPDAAVGGTFDVPIEIDDIPTISPAPGDGNGNHGGGGHDGEKPPVKDTDIRVPTADDKLRVAVVGDSLAAGVGYYAERVFKAFFVDVVKQGQISTGLARPDYFNWPARMRYIVDSYRPDLTLVMIGENDNQSLQTPQGGLDTAIGTFEWAKAYEARVERFAKIATSHGGHVIWVGLPVQRDHARWEFIQRQNAIFEAVADRLPNVAYFDSWNAFANGDGDYTAYYRDGNQVELIRADDGIHFNGTGYAVLAEKVAELAASEFGLDPRTFGP